MVGIKGHQAETEHEPWAGNNFCAGGADTKEPGMVEHVDVCDSSCGVW